MSNKNTIYRKIYGIAQKCLISVTKDVTEIRNLHILTNIPMVFWICKRTDSVHSDVFIQRKTDRRYKYAEGYVS